MRRALFFVGRLDGSVVKPPFNGGPARVRLGDVCEIIMGQSPSSENYNDRELGLPFFQGNADFGKEHPTAKVWCDNPIKIAHKGDLLLSVRAPIGAINTAAEECCIGRGVAAIRPKPNTIDLDYLKHQLIAARPRLESLGTGSTFKAIGKKLLNDYPIMLDSLENQQNIAHQLAYVNQCIALKEATIDRLNLLVKSRFNEMFGDPTRQSNKTWTYRKLGDLLLIERGSSPRPIKAYLTEDTAGINWIKIGDAADNEKYIVSTKERITQEGARASRLVYAGDFVLSNSMSFGKPYILKTDGCIHDGWLVLRDQSGYFDQLWLYEALASQDVNMAFKQLARGGVVNNLNKDLVSSVCISVPPLPLQQEFANFVSQVDKLRFMNSLHCPPYQPR